MARTGLGTIRLNDTQTSLYIRPTPFRLRRGLLATCYVQTSGDARALVEAASASSPAVRVLTEGVVPEPMFTLCVLDPKNSRSIDPDAANPFTLVTFNAFT